ncbi:hypothetical protein LDJ79_00960 [Vibrio tritonius]|uniref:Type II and III secretion system protein n=1 Tax=Vibrio tritonius TaxID=1435069 RepID=A0ABS7YJL9_9VIBR|nr:hypothetical protein [Vibrio tritonius]MCA2014659.1 hypothetical protein [Vibrio tritonius]
MSQLPFKRSVITYLVLALSGCSVATKHEEYDRAAKMHQQEIIKTKNDFDYKKVVTLDMPPQKAGLFVDSHEPEWLNIKDSITFTDTPLSVVLQAILGNNVKIIYGEGVNPDVKVSLFNSGTMKEKLSLLESYSNYGLTAKDDTLTVNKYISRTFVIPSPPGQQSYQIGSSSQGSSSSSTDDATNGESVSGTNAGDGQYSNLSVEKYNITQQMYNGIIAILGGKVKDKDSSSSSTKSTTTASKTFDSKADNQIGYAQVIPAMSAIIVRTSPSLMKEVDKFVDQLIQTITRQVLLDVEVVEFQSEDGVEFGLNGTLDVAKSDSTYTLNSAVPVLDTAESTIGLGLSGTSGLLKDSDLSLKATESHATVSVKNKQSFLASNNQMQEIDLSTLQPYTSKIEVTYTTTDDENYPTTSIEKETVRDGVKMLVVANIQPNKVYLRADGTYTKFIKFITESVNGESYQSPKTRQSKFNLSNFMQYNKTYVLAHMRQESFESNDNKFATVSTGNDGKKKVTDTLVLLTPHLQSN